MTDDLRELADDLCAAWQAKSPMHDVLSRFVAMTDSRASGCWRLESGFLDLVGFGWALDMSPEVSDGFQAATRRLSMSQTGLGVVQAAVSGHPVIARLEVGATGLEGSAAWLVRFGAKSSLAVPIRNPSGDIAGVIAISTAAVLHVNDDLWRMIGQLADQLGQTEDERSRR